ncbi:sugar-transfer associated ATP-grasp domain-containing protein [Jannaschia sp. M317]|uniref:sugar-transfer associated ATP-grasp domain-containing protein n=1 Tax=Jannaschia sp. M317 TaxID=2867011 RepID=UPI0021A8FEDC|nr:sugar-transfer associated ATP-grasp domain-containing protein [Jannaschia sp. M317]UWQ16386.1 hypothetical protein K3551_10655 [Jannaschia sp. M317]
MTQQTTFDREMAASTPVTLSNSDYLSHAARASGRSVLDVTMEFKKLERGPGRLALPEYVFYGLHHADRFDADDRAAFVSEALHWPMVHAVNPRGWNAAAEEKTLAGLILAAGGVPVPETLAVFDRSARLHPGLPSVTSADGLRDLVLAEGGKGLFGKDLSGMSSAGAFRIDAADRDGVTRSGAPATDWDRFVADAIGDRAYLLQRQVHNHAAITPYATALATVRVAIFMMHNGPCVRHAVIKLPQGRNIADNFWRAGNLACGIDIDSGRVIRIARDGGSELEYLADHPEVPGLMGLDLPDWDHLHDVVSRAARLFAPLKYQTMDVALTPDGPVVVELNDGGSFKLLQTGLGCGIGTEDFHRFFAPAAARQDPPKRGLGALLRRARG